MSFVLDPLPSFDPGLSAIESREIASVRNAIPVARTMTNRFIGQPRAEGGRWSNSMPRGDILWQWFIRSVPPTLNIRPRFGIGIDSGNGAGRQVPTLTQRISGHPADVSMSRPYGERSVVSFWGFDNGETMPTDRRAGSAADCPGVPQGVVAELAFRCT